MHGVSWRSLVGSGPLLLLLSGLYPAVFLMSRNRYIYTGSQITLLLIATPLLALALGLAVHGLGRAGRSLAGSSPPSGEGGTSRLGAALWAALAVGVVVFLLQSSVRTLVPSDGHVWLVGAVAAVLVSPLATRVGLGALCTILALLTLLSAGQWLVAHFDAERRIASLWYTDDRETWEAVHFESMPNVYLVVAESYVSARALDEIYDAANAEMYAELRSLGFRIHLGAHANYPDTLTSLTALFTMAHHDYRIAVGNLDALGARDIIGSRLYNPVLATFRNNGYVTQFVNQSDFVFKQGPDLTHAFPERRIEGVFRVFQIPWVDRWVAGLGDDADHRDIRYVPGQAYLDRVRARVDVAATSDEPYFTYTHLPHPGHSPNDRTWDAMDDFVRRYPESIRRANGWLLRIVRHILDRDPGAIVVLMGDHGAHRFRRAWESDDGGDLHAVLRERGIPEDVLALDLFGILLAIRLPEGVRTALPEVVTPVNLFRHLFAILSGREDLVAKRAKDESLAPTGHVAARDGVPLRRWESVDSEAEARKRRASADRGR